MEGWNVVEEEAESRKYRKSCAYTTSRSHYPRNIDISPTSSVYPLLLCTSTLSNLGRLAEAVGGERAISPAL
jgi:hypothetical protein